MIRERSQDGRIVKLNARLADGVKTNMKFLIGMDNNGVLLGLARLKGNTDE